MGILRQSAVVLALNWLLMPLGFIMGALVARAVGPEGKGVLFLLAGVSGVLGSLFSFGLSSAAIYHHKQDSLSLGQILGVCFLLAGLSIVAASLIFVIGAGVFVQLFMGMTETMVAQPIWIWLTVLTLLPALITGPATALLIADGEMKLYTLTSIAGGFLGLGLTWLFALLLGGGITGVLLSQMLTSLFPVVVMLHWMRSKGAVARLELTRTAIREMLRIGLQHYGLSLTGILTKRFDAFLIGALLTIRDAGYFSIAYGLFNAFLSLPRAGVLPLISKMASKDDDRVAQSYRMCRLQFTLMIAMLVVFAPLAPWFVEVVYGEAFLPAVGAVWLILPAIAGANLCVVSSACLDGVGQARRVILPALVGSVLQVVVGLLTVPRIGVEGSSIAQVALYFSTATLIYLVTGRRQLDLVRMTLMTTDDIRSAAAGLFGLWRQVRTKAS